MTTVAEGMAMTGAEYLALLAEDFQAHAPIGRTLGIDEFRLEDDGVAVSMQPGEEHENPLGVVHGGVLSTLLDTACACAVHADLGAGQYSTSLDLHVKFLRPVTGRTGRITATGRLVQRGRTTALAEAQLHDGEGRLLAHATSTCVIVERQAAASAG